MDQLDPFQTDDAIIKWWYDKLTTEIYRKKRVGRFFIQYLAEKIAYYASLSAWYAEYTRRLSIENSALRNRLKGYENANNLHE